MRELTLGSLFDGSGGFPLAAALEGIRPVWASEVEPYPIAVTRSRFPYMKHEGDVSQLNGATLEPVDIITFGSPCQDLSVAGKRAGLLHESKGDEETTRSGLFLEAIRIIKELREATHGVYPAYAIWENVTGAFSSSGGEDFRTVLNEFVHIVEPGAEVPPPPQGKWAYADVLVGDGWSVAYRTFDAQYWGVPQRRRRIYLVADFRGERAGEILFKRAGLRGHNAPRREAGERTAAETQNDVGTADKCAAFKVGNSAKARTIGYEEEKSPTLSADAGGNTVPAVVAPTTSAKYGTGGNNQPLVVYSIGSHNSEGMKSPNPQSGIYEADTARTIDANGGNPACNQGGMVVLEGNGTRPSHRGDGWSESDVSYTLNTIERHAVAYGIDTNQRYIVRRLTPLECCRLQGFPDGWGETEAKDDLTDEEFAFWLDVRNTHGRINGKAVRHYTKAQMVTWYNKLHTDSAEYKMWGNGIALPCARYVMQGIVDAVKEDEENV